MFKLGFVIVFVVVAACNFLSSSKAKGLPGLDDLGSTYDFQTKEKGVTAFTLLQARLCSRDNLIRWFLKIHLTSRSFLLETLNWFFVTHGIYFFLKNHERKGNVGTTSQTWDEILRGVNPSFWSCNNCSGSKMFLKKFKEFREHQWGGVLTKHWPQVNWPPTDPPTDPL